MSTTINDLCDVSWHSNQAAHMSGHTFLFIAKHLAEGIVMIRRPATFTHSIVPPGLEQECSSEVFEDADFPETVPPWCGLSASEYDLFKRDLVGTHVPVCTLSKERVEEVIRCSKVTRYRQYLVQQYLAYAAD